MNAARILAIVLIAAGVLGLLYHSFSYTKSSQAAKVGSLELTVQHKETVAGGRRHRRRCGTVGVRRSQALSSLSP
jgi:hypothetical protein